MKTKKFKELFDFLRKSRIKAGAGLEDGNFPFFTSSTTQKKRIDKAEYFEEALIFGTGGIANVHFAGEPFATSTDCLVAVTKEENLSAKFVYYYLFGNIQILERGFIGGGLKHISKKYIENLDIPVLPIVTQNKIVSVLDKASLIINKRKESLKLLDEILKSSFIELFGDPIINPKSWPLKNLEKSVKIIRDGPFGSNLKTEHYTDSGVRIIRLQNIGVNAFIDDNKEFISEKHAELLKNYLCLPGDVLVGTLGVPNLRACKFPESMERAINKADCIQIRPNELFLNSAYLSFFMNLPSALFLVSNYIRGQTRSRISKGLLAKIDIPIPPIELQNEFLNFEKKIEKIKGDLLKKNLNDFFQSVLQKVFNGELNFNVDFELDALIQEINIESKENDLSKIAGDIAYLQKLIDKMNNQEYKEKEMYDKAKFCIFKLLEVDLKEKKIVQAFDKKSKSLKLFLK